MNNKVGLDGQPNAPKGPVGLKQTWEDLWRCHVALWYAIMQPIIEMEFECR